jgi:hypothetical protein
MSVLAVIGWYTKLSTEQIVVKTRYRPIDVAAYKPAYKKLTKNPDFSLLQPSSNDTADSAEKSNSQILFLDSNSMYWNGLDAKKQQLALFVNDTNETTAGWTIIELL